ncbi:hypothetical protein [Laspinema olomoucense]|uniref:Late competence development protein ComFB n=1 Tax=Laspinema olomoucense D3b TaxID=2953688 RepID=A0ABT2NJI3_9CYAN|nr:hypothetical protein [Laspinema sp. D3b]MCT7981456.1 hypothetical protein [Laspinema sp. D3b]
MPNILELATQLELEPDQIESVCAIFGLAVDGAGTINTHSSKLNQPLQLESLLERLLEKSRTHKIPLEVLAQKLLDEMILLATHKTQQREPHSNNKFDLDAYFQARYGVAPEQLAKGSIPDFIYEMLRTTYQPMSDQITAMGYEFLTLQVQANLTQGWQSDERGKCSEAIASALESLQTGMDNLLDWQKPTNVPALGSSPSRKQITPTLSNE